MRQPDFDNLLRVLNRQKPRRPTLFEFFLNDRLYERLTGMPLATESLLERARWMMRAYAAAGYDFVGTGGSSFRFPTGERPAAATISLNAGSVIADRASFDAYDWPDPDRFDYSALEVLGRELPAGMKLMAWGPNGLLENVVRLVGYENLCYMTGDDPALAADVFAAVGSRLVRHYEICASFPAVGVIMDNDDWGFKTQPMLSPAQLRQYVFPWHRRIAQAAHAAGKPVILHSCGNLESVMDDIIDDLRIDAKHSFEDAIEPVEQAYERYGSRIAILGGIDVDFICRAGPDAVTRRSQAMLDRAVARGGYALGTGNSVPYYVPDDHYAAMIAAVTGPVIWAGG